MEVSSEKESSTGKRHYFWMIVDVSMTTSLNDNLSMTWDALKSTTLDIPQFQLVRTRHRLFKLPASSTVVLQTTVVATSKRVDLMVGKDQRSGSSHTHKIEILAAHQIRISMSFTTTANHFLDTKVRGFYYMGQQPPYLTSPYGGSHSVSLKVKIHDGRSGAEKLTLDQAGFELIDCPTGLSTQDFYIMHETGEEGGRQEELRNSYFKEVSEIVRLKLGCDKVICIHSSVRNSEKVDETSGESIQGYATGSPHTDASPVTGDEAALDVLLGASKKASQSAEANVEFKATSYKRYLYLSLWRNIADHPIENDSLALLDDRTTIKPDDYISRDIFSPAFGHAVNYGLNARHASEHKWYYFPKLKKQEAILFKQIDSDWTKAARTCFHMSANNAEAPVDAKPRESIEVRMICYWKDADVDSMPRTKDVADARSVVHAPQGLATANLYELSVALLTRIPILGVFVSRFFGNPFVSTIVATIFPPSKKFQPFSGDPNDYVDNIHQALALYDDWPPFAKRMLESQMAREKDPIKYITKTLVDDATGAFGTKKFEKEIKEAIISACLTNEEYMNTGRKQMKNFLKEPSNSTSEKRSN